MTDSLRDVVGGVPDADAALFVRGLHRRYGAHTVAYAAQRARALREVGDAEGADLWQRLTAYAEEIGARPLGPSEAPAD